MFQWVANLRKKYKTRCEINRLRWEIKHFDERINGYVKTLDVYPHLNLSFGKRDDPIFDDKYIRRDKEDLDKLIAKRQELRARLFELERGE